MGCAGTVEGPYVLAQDDASGGWTEPLYRNERCAIHLMSSGVVPPMLRIRVSFTFCPGNNLPLYAELGRICSGVLKLRIQRHCFRVSAIGGSGHYWRDTDLLVRTDAGLVD